MVKLFKYEGTISGFSYVKREGGIANVDMILVDINDFDKAPTRIEAFGAIAEYINKIEGTDAEERYIKSNWFYDSNLYLYYIEVPSESGRPAKIITSDDFLGDNLKIFGPEEYIEESNPDPMSMEAVHEWNEWKWNHF